MPALILSQTIEGFILSKRAEGRSPATIENYRYAAGKLVDHLGDLPITDITADHLRAFFAQLADLSPKSRRNIQISLSSLWTWAIAEGYATTHIVKSMAQIRVYPPDIQAFTEADLRKLLRACDKTKPYSSTQHPPNTVNTRPTAARDRAIIMFLVDTGVRASELCDLVIDDVNMETRAATIRHGKGSKSRIVQFGKRCHQILWQYLITRQPHAQTTEPLFHTGPVDIPGHLDRTILYHLVTRIGDRAGVRDVSVHRFRHTFAIQFLRNGGNLFALQDLLGHSDLQMVRRYARLVQADRVAAHQIASPADNWRL